MKAILRIAVVGATLIAAPLPTADAATPAFPVYDCVIEMEFDGFVPPPLEGAFGLTSGYSGFQFDTASGLLRYREDYSFEQDYSGGYQDPEKWEIIRTGSNIDVWVATYSEPGWLYGAPTLGRAPYVLRINPSEEPWAEGQHNRFYMDRWGFILTGRCNE